MLKIKNINVSYGGIKALQDVSLEVPEGKVVTLIGANGAGKSTLLKSIAGIVTPDSGSIEFLGNNIAGNKVYKTVGEGIALVPEGRKVFTDLTVAENLKIGSFLRNDKKEIEKDMEWIYSLFPRLKERSWQ